MTTSASPKSKKLSAEQARALADAKNRLDKAGAEYGQAKEAFEQLQDRYRDRITEPSADPKDKGKDIVIAKAGGWLVRVARWKSARTFSLKDYLAAGHEITPAMADHVHGPEEDDPTDRETWTVKRLAGPYKPGSVEPAG